LIALSFPLHLFAAQKEAAKKMPAVSSGKPELFELDPRGIQRGSTNRIKLIGTNLIGLTEVRLHNSKITGVLLDDPEATTNVAWIEIGVPLDLSRGAYELSVKNTNAESGKLKLYVDDLPQAFENSATNAGRGPVLHLPLSFWGTIDPPGDVDDISFEAAAGDSLVFDVAAKSIGSKANAMITLFDDRGAVLAANAGFEGGDSLLHFQIARRGTYRLRVTERADAGSRDHFYRASIGKFTVATGHIPLGISANKETEVQLVGFNLTPSSLVRLNTSAAGEMDVPIPPEYRTRRPFKVVVNSNPEIVENEPNDTTSTAMPLEVGTTVDGLIASRPGEPADVDIFQFEAHRDQTLVLETDAARRGSPIDTKIELLQADGKPVERLLLQAVRDSHVTFRGIDSTTDDLRVENWQEMELNQLMYLQGEVCKIFRMPQGPDSGFQFYNAGGKRRNYFDTSPVAHALDEPAYIVEPHPLGAKLVPNGLPVFTLYYASDDDAERSLGSDSKLLFTPPKDGKYFVRVTDTRGQGGDRFAYRLLLRHAQADFSVTLGGANPSVNAGAGKGF
jgi:hypothetical protein